MSNFKKALKVMKDEIHSTCDLLEQSLAHSSTVQVICQHFLAFSVDLCVFPSWLGKDLFIPLSLAPGPVSYIS